MKYELDVRHLPKGQQLASDLAPLEAFYRAHKPGVSRIAVTRPQLERAHREAVAHRNGFLLDVVTKTVKHDGFELFEAQR